MFQITYLREEHRRGFDNYKVRKILLFQSIIIIIIISVKVLTNIYN